MNLVNRMVAKKMVAKLSWTLVAAFSTVAVLSACGQQASNNLLSPETGIVGGAESVGTEDFAKHVVGLYDVKIGAICTASILSESILVTAAHCVDSEPSALRVVFGGDFNSSNVVVRIVDDYRLSPIWAFRQGQEFNTGDIALVKFSGGLPAGYAPAQFLTDVTKLTDNMNVLLAGYGASFVTQVPDPRTGALVADHQGAGKLRFVTTTINKVAYSKSEFLTDSSKGKAACHGDSGGPAYVEIDGKQVLTGVTSRSAGDAQDLCNVAAVYTSIPFYAPWIIATSKQLNAASPVDRTPATVATR